MRQIDAQKWLEYNYPLISQRKEPISSLSYALKDKNSLALIDNHFGEGTALNWVKAQLLDTFRICGAGEIVISYQIVTIARRIRKIYYYLSLSELTYFFEALIGGNYGTIYVGKNINPQNITEALKIFDTERANRISEIEDEEEKERRSKEKEEIKKGNTGLNGWLKYKKEKGISDTSICESIIKEINRKKFNK